MTRQINQAGIDLITSFEKFEPDAYLDGAGIPTVGWGHTGPDVYIGLTITRERGVELLRNDLRVAEEGVQRLVIISLGDNQFAALTSFAFNCGVHTLEKAPLLKLLNLKMYAAIPAHLSLYIHDHKGNVERGLVKRRAAEIALWNKPDQPSTENEDVATIA